MRESSADDFDKAAELTQHLADSAVAVARKAAAPQQVQCVDGSWPNPDCADCSEPIPEVRLKLGRIRCVDCQDAIERGWGRNR